MLGVPGLPVKPHEAEFWTVNLSTRHTRHTYCAPVPRNPTRSDTITIMTTPDPEFTVHDSAGFTEAVATLAGMHRAAAAIHHQATELADSLATADPAPGTVVPPALAALLAAAAEQVRELASDAGTTATRLAGTAQRLGAVQGSTEAVDESHPCGRTGLAVGIGGHDLRR